MSFDLIRDAIKNAVSEAAEIVIVSHKSPDGDSIGSSVALAKALLQMGKSVEIVIDDDIPLKYSFLAGADKIKKSDDVVVSQESTVIFLDCGDEKRGGSQIEAYIKKCRLSINIDHHIKNTNFADINYVDISASATGEIIYELIKSMDIVIDKDIANALYVAIIADTGNFSFDNTTAKTFSIASDLRARGLDFSMIRTNIWESETPNSIALLANVLSTLKFACNNKISYIVVTNEMLEKWQVGYGELENLVKYPKSITGIEIALIFKEMEPNKTKVSFRAKADIDVQEIAAYFGGGGHKSAAGCTLDTTLDEGIKTVIEYLQKRLA